MTPAAKVKAPKPVTGWVVRCAFDAVVTQNDDGRLAVYATRRQARAARIYRGDGVHRVEIRPASPRGGKGKG